MPLASDYPQDETHEIFVYSYLFSITEGQRIEGVADADSVPVPLIVPHAREFASGQGQARRLAVMIGERHCLVHMAETAEILPLGDLGLPVRIPLTRSWFLGLVKWRGNLIGITDLAILWGQAPQPSEGRSRLLVFAAHLAPHCGLLLSSVLGLRSVDRMTKTSGDEEEHQLPGIIARYRDDDGIDWSEIGLARLLNDAAFLRIGI